MKPCSCPHVNPNERRVVCCNRHQPTIVYKEKMYPSVKIATDVQNQFLGIHVKMVKIEGITVQQRAGFMTARRKRILNSIRARYRSSDVRMDPIVRAYRELYSKIGLDPDETPPSVQALILRFLKNDQFPNINSVVDAVNLAALESMIPLGVFDIDAVEGEIVLRFSRDGEPFLELGKASAYPLKQGRLVLADDKKILSVFYWRDSEHQKIRENTKNVAVLACQVPGISDEMIENSLRIAEDIVRMAHGLAK